MQILKIKLSTDEQTAIFNELTKRFNVEDAKQTTEFNLFDCIEFIIASRYEFTSDLYSCESTLDLYTEYPEPDENNQTAISNRSIVKFQITFYHDGEEVEVEDWDIDDRIKKYYEI